MKQVKIQSIDDLPATFFSPTSISQRIEKHIARILQKVESQGDRAVLDYTAKFDGVKLTQRSLKISIAKARSAWLKAPAGVRKALNIAKKNIQKYHSAQLPFQWEIELKHGAILGQLYRPIERIGVYVPGGRAPLVSTVLMTVVPAKVAGVKEVVLVTPPRANRYILAAAYISGATEIYQVGGPQAIGALAYGTETIPKVDKIIGPGNIYVTCAKHQVFGVVDIDLLAGPSEVLIIADNTAKKTFIVADLLSQLEHDPLSRAILITNSSKIYKEISSQLTAKGLWVIKVPDISLAIELANRIAPEHLELMIKNPQKAVKKIKNAGIILIGPYTPVSVSDFLAGTNHVLPTGGTARSFSGLTVWNFIKPISTVEYTKEALIKAKPYIKTFARIEGLDAHAESVEMR